MDYVSVLKLIERRLRICMPTITLLNNKNNDDDCPNSRARKGVKKRVEMMREYGKF